MSEEFDPSCSFTTCSFTVIEQTWTLLRVVGVLHSYAFATALKAKPVIHFTTL